MPWQTPKSDWTSANGVADIDINRMESNSQYLKDILDGNTLTYKGTLGSNTDLNAIVTPGFYVIGDTAAMANFPPSSAWSILEVLLNTYVVQRISGVGVPVAYYRTRNEGTTWGPWTRTDVAGIRADSSKPFIPEVRTTDPAGAPNGTLYFRSDL